MKKNWFVVLTLLVVASLLTGCGTAAPTPAASGDIYIPVISKGFQHQFWQAVKMGAEQAAKDFNVKITFEGPESESQVDKQVEMVEAALAKNPKALCLAARIRC